MGRNNNVQAHLGWSCVHLVRRNREASLDDTSPSMAILRLSQSRIGSHPQLLVNVLKIDLF